MDRYHTRHPDKEMSREEIGEVIAGQRLITIAMSLEGAPYLVTVNYAYDSLANCFYFHAAKQGKKMDYLRANPVVWGQIMEDRGYVQGRCEHHFRTVQFQGKAAVLKDDQEIKQAMVLLIDQQEDDPDPVKKRNIDTGEYAKAAMVRIDVTGFTGKKSQGA